MGSIATLAVCMAAAACKKATTEKAASQPGTITAPLDYLAAQGRAKQVAIKVTDMAQLNSAVQKFQAMEDRYPRDFNEMIAGRYLTEIPTPPRGMRFTYNPQTGQVAVVPEGSVSAITPGGPTPPARPRRGPGGIPLPATPGGGYQPEQ